MFRPEKFLHWCKICIYTICNWPLTEIDNHWKQCWQIGADRNLCNRAKYAAKEYAYSRQGELQDQPPCWSRLHSGSNICRTRANIRTSSTSRLDQQLHAPRTKTKTSLWGFYYASSAVWNSLPADLRDPGLSLYSSEQNLNLIFITGLFLYFIIVAFFAERTVHQRDTQ